MTIIEYTHSMKPQLTDLLAAYFPEVASDIPEDIVRGKLSDFIDDQHRQGILQISIAFDADTPMGFSVYQIDKPDSDWCKRPGWGFIREFYIAPEYRKQGLGRQLVRHSEQCLLKMGAKGLYLTSETAIPFWQRCGWRVTGELCSNDLNILEK